MFMSTKSSVFPDRGKGSWSQNNNRLRLLNSNIDKCITAFWALLVDKLFKRMRWVKKFGFCIKLWKSFQWPHLQQSHNLVTNGEMWLQTCWCFVNVNQAYMYVNKCLLHGREDVHILCVTNIQHTEVWAKWPKTCIPHFQFYLLK